jgi:hypothetical protein
MPDATINTRSVRFELKTKEIEGLFDKAPSPSYFWLRDFLGQQFGRHRNKWLRAKGTKFGRPSKGGVNVPQLNQGPPGTPPPNFVVYRVEPKDKRFRNPRAATRALNQLGAAAFTGSFVLRIHQFGEDIVSTRKLMAIPVRTRGTPKEFRARSKNPLIALPARGGTAKALLYERKRVRAGTRTRLRRTKRGKIARSQPKTKVDRLRLRYVLTRRAEMDETLKFYDTWGAMKPERDRAFKRAADRIVRDIARGVTS